ncbi:MAG TPA: hypothetical protein VFR73_24390 [Hyphomicrobiaceae bacterium]|nr:hypothetical protein [Hyphomicrobiaceae bacterium]
MGKALAIVVCATSAAVLGGCTELVRRQATGSLKDDLATPVRVLSVPARPEVIRETIKEPAKAETAKPEPAKADTSIVDKARAEQSARCGQRHVDHGNGTLKETENEKQVADSICVELHRYDHVR